SSGSRAMWAISGGSTAPPGENAIAPNVRWSTNRSWGPPSSKVSRTRRWVSSGAPGGRSSSWPDMPRCTTRASPVSSGSHRNLPRRRAPVTVRPGSAAAKSAAPARWRRTARGWRTSTAASRRPTTHFSRPRRTVSTSGSSGTASAAGQLAPGGGRRLLLGLLLARAGDPAVPGAGHDHPGGERLGVVGPLLLHLVLRHPEPPLGGQLLQ